MKSLSNKIKKGALFGMALLLPFFPFQKLTAQETPNNSSWNYWFGTTSIVPHDETLKTIFGSYWGLTAEAQKEIAKNIYISPSFACGWAKANLGEITYGVGFSELSTLILYKLDNLEIGAGPTFSNLAIKSKWIDENSETGISEGEGAYQSFGLTAGMKYFIPLSKWFSIFLHGRYTFTKTNEGEFPENLGTSRYGFGFSFN
ncbi:MAG: hypothetical protein PHU63_03030 [Candidatus ainarchaeum sp.]|nr:hypothetical protein [Candidatus ainarchaeum sp.]